MTRSTLVPIVLGALARLAVFASLVTLSCAGARLEPRAPAPGQPVMTVMSYNVNFGLACDGPTLDAIAGAEVDAILLQETTPAWERCLRARLGDRYPHMAFRHRGGAGGMAVIARLPFDEGDTMPSPIGWFPGWRVVLDGPIGKVQALQVHLRPQVSDGGSYVVGYLATGGDRLAELESYLPALDPRLPTLVAGDFNEQRGAAVRTLRRRGLRDVVDDFDLGTTWRWQTSLGTVRMRLDHIFYDPALVPLEARVESRGRSDHLPIVARFAARFAAR